MTRIVDENSNHLLLRRRLLADGYSSSEVERARAGGEIRTIHRGVYSPAAHFDRQSLLSQHVLRAQAAARAAPSVVVSHISAAAFHLLPVGSACIDQVHLTRAGRTGARRNAGRILHVSPLEPGDVVRIGGVPVTSLVRTLVDIARTESFETAVAAADAGLHARPGIADELAQALERTRGRVGAGAARRALSFADGRAESVGESRLRIVLKDLVLPEPDLQCRIFGREGEPLGRTDFGLLNDGLLIEFDGKVKYKDPAMTGGRDIVDLLLDEAAREKRIRELGWQVLRVVWSELFDLPTLERRIRALQARGRAVLASVGIDGSVRPLPPVRIAR